MKKKKFVMASKKPSVKRNIIDELSDSLSPIIDSAHSQTVQQSPFTNPSLTIDSAHAHTAQSPLTGPCRDGQGDKSKVTVGSTTSGGLGATPSVDLGSIDSPLTERGGEKGAVGGAASVSTAADILTPLSLSTTPLQGSTPICWDDDIPTTGSQPTQPQLITQQDGLEYMSAAGEGALKNSQVLCQQHDQGITDSAMDHTPGTSKRARTTDSPVKGQRASKITAVEAKADGESSTDSEQETTGKEKKGSKAVDQSQQQQTSTAQQAHSLPGESQQPNQLPLLQLLLQRISVLEAQAEHQIITSNNLQQSLQSLEESSLNIFGNTQARFDNHGERLVKAETNLVLAMDSVEGIQQLTQRVSAAESNVATLHAAVNNHRLNFDRQLKDMERKFQEAIDLQGPSINSQEAAGAGPGRADQDVAFFISGIQLLKAYLKLGPQADPTEPIIKLMKEWGQYSAIIRIMAADKQAGNRSKVNAVIVVMTSTFQKKTAVSNLKGLLKTANAKGNLRGITIKDCFGTHAQPRARALTRYAGHLREQQDISGYRVINKQGEAFLQTYQGNSDWQDVNISDEDLVPFYMTREEREKGSAMELEGVANPTAHSPPLQQQPNFAPLQHQFTHLQQQHSMPQHQARGNLMNRGGAAQIRGAHRGAATAAAYSSAPSNNTYSRGGAIPKTTAYNRPPTTHQHESHRREEERQRWEFNRTRSMDEESNQEEEGRNERGEQRDERSAAEHFAETAAVKKAKAVLAAHSARLAAATNTSTRKAKGYHTYTGKHKNSNY